MTEPSFWLLHFEPIVASSVDKIFGFSEFLTAIALFAVIYTISDVRYKFRIAVTPGKLYRNTFGLITIIGIQALLTEIWIMEGWWVPKDIYITYPIWQGIFGLLFLTTFMTWMYYAFIRPPVFGPQNALRYAQELYSYILHGNDDELKIIATELARSSKQLISHCRPIQRRESQGEASEAKVKPRKPNAGDYASDILLLIANRKFCKNVVASSPVTAQYFFEDMTDLTKYNIPIGQFAKNILAEAVAQNDSFLYSEEDGFSSGLLGDLKPVSKASYGNHLLMENLAKIYPSPFNIDYKEAQSWAPEQWKAYCRAVLITINDLLKNGRGTDNVITLTFAIDTMKLAYGDLYKLDGGSETYYSDTHQQLGVIVDFIMETLKAIDEQEILPKPLNDIGSKANYPIDIYDQLANFIYDVILSASYVKSPPDVCWGIHYSSIWSNLFAGPYSDKDAWEIVCSKVSYLLLDEINRLLTYPNFQGSKILGFCLNTLGLELAPRGTTMGDISYSLAKDVQAWTKKNYLPLHRENAVIAESALIGNLSFEEANKRLVYTGGSILGREPPKFFLDLDD